jgi:hypothetical protein
MNFSFLMVIFFLCLTLGGNYLNIPVYLLKLVCNIKFSACLIVEQIVRMAGKCVIQILRMMVALDNCR